jgi:hypothetical protein
MSDTIQTTVTGATDDRDRLIKALELAPIRAVTGVHWEKSQLILKREVRSSETTDQKMSFAPELMVDVILEFMNRKPGSNKTYAAPIWPPEPDLDGSCRKGWRLEADNRSITIDPFWMIYHK